MNIILFGSTGMLGRYIFSVLNNTNNYNIIAISREQYDIEKDDNDFSKLFKIFQHKYKLNANDVIINSVGIIPQKYDIHDLNYHNMYIKINTIFPHKLNEISKKNNLKFIHITTDCVFNGISGNYDETSINKNNNINNKDIYSITKLSGEPKDATIIRTSIIGEEINNNMNNNNSLLKWVISNKNKEINGYKNHLWNGVTCLTLANIIKEIIDKNKYWVGVRHFFSPDIISKYDLCNLINKIYELDITINPVKCSISKNMTLNTIYLNQNYLPIYNIEEQIREQKLYNIEEKIREYNYIKYNT